MMAVAMEVADARAGPAPCLDAWFVTSREPWNDGRIFTRVNIPAYPGDSPQVDGKFG